VQCFTVSDFIYYVRFGIVGLQTARCQVVGYEPRGIVDTRDTCAVSRYLLLLRYTAVYRDFGDTGIVT